MDERKASLQIILKKNPKFYCKVFLNHPVTKGAQCLTEDDLETDSSAGVNSKHLLLYTILGF